MPRGKKKHPVAAAIAAAKQRQLAAGRARAQFTAALQGERLGEHPEQVELKIGFALKVRAGGTNQILPPIPLLVSSFEDLEAAKSACVAGLKAWLAGHVAGEWIKCSCGQFVPPINSKRKLNG